MYKTFSYFKRVLGLKLEESYEHAATASQQCIFDANQASATVQDFKIG